MLVGVHGVRFVYCKGRVKLVEVYRVRLTPTKCVGALLMLGVSVLTAAMLVGGL